MPGRAIARCHRRLVVAADHPRRLAGDSPLQRISEEHRARQEHPDGAAAHARGPGHPEDGARLRRQRLSGVRADTEGARGISGAGRAAAVERGILRRARRLPYPPGRPHQGPPGAEARTTLCGWPVARRWRYRSESESGPEAPPARVGLSEHLRYGVAGAPFWSKLHPIPRITAGILFFGTQLEG